MSGNRELALLQSATQALAQVSSAQDAWELSRTAEAARRYAQMKNMGAEAVNYATGIKAKAMIMLAEFIDAGQADGTIAQRGRPVNSPEGGIYSIPEVLGSEAEPRKAHRAVEEARRTRDALAGANIDVLVAEANQSGVDFGLSGLRMAAASKADPSPPPAPVPPKRGRFRCIVIDPPWPVSKVERRERPSQGRALSYPTMSIEDIADERLVPVQSHADHDCHLYLWVTHKYLPDGLDLVAKWGFDYQCVMTWRKNVGMTPYSWMYDTEHVLFARRGNLPLLRLGMRLSFDAPVVGHSIKPDAFYDLASQASPGPRLDMFPGVEHEGFEPWGLEASHRV